MQTFIHTDIKISSTASFSKKKFWHRFTFLSLCYRLCTAQILLVVIRRNIIIHNILAMHEMLITKMEKYNLQPSMQVNNYLINK